MRLPTSHEVDPNLDREWAEEVDLEIGIHPDLPSTQRAAVEMDYGMTEGFRSIRVRAALADYTIESLRADRDAAVVGPEQAPLIFLNQDAIRRSIEALRDETSRWIQAVQVTRLNAV